MASGEPDLQRLLDFSFRQKVPRGWVIVDFGKWHVLFWGDVTLRPNIRSQIDVDFGAQCWFLSFGLCFIFCLGPGACSLGANIGKVGYAHTKWAYLSPFTAAPRVGWCLHRNGYLQRFIQTVVLGSTRLSLS